MVVVVGDEGNGVEAGEVRRKTRTKPVGPN
jgi:hypothetical protein